MRSSLLPSPLSRQRITPLEIVGWLLFFSFLLVAELMRFSRLETLLLVIGFSIGLMSTYKAATLGKEGYEKHRQEITAWLVRFVVFKVVPLAAVIVYKAV